MMMEKKLFFFVLVVTVAGHKNFTRFRKNAEDASAEDNSQPVPTKIACSSNHARERDEIIDQSVCGEPKELLQYLKINKPHEQVSPRAVWVKRCVGLCEFDNDGTCTPTETITRHIPIRIYNLKTDKELCTTHPITEHVSCACCTPSDEYCLNTSFWENVRPTTIFVTIPE